MDNTDAIDTLNGLIEISKDGEFGFRASAEQAQAQKLRQALLERADECAAAARELQDEVVALGGEPEDGGSAAGAVHRGWVSVKATLSRHTDHEILEEVERGEDKALEHYQQAAVDERLPASARALVQRQLEGVRRNHDQMRALRDGTPA